MNRGATAYGLRGVGLALPNGTLENPALRFGRERSGLYRAGDGRWAVGIKRFRTLEVTENDVFVRSNSPGAGLVAPLAMARANATTADGQETAFDVYETNVPIARMSVYRESPTLYGWKFYGFNAGLGALPLLTLAGSGGIGFGGDVSVTGHLGVGGPSIAGSVVAVHVAGGGSGIVQGSTASHVLSLSNVAPGAAPTAQVHLGLAVGGPAYLGVANDASLYTTAGALILGSSGLARFRINVGGDMRFILGSPANSVQVLKSTDGSPVFTISDVGATGLAINAVGSPQIVDGSIAAGDIASGVIQPRTATLVVAASNASAASKAAADYVCDGVADNVEINAALNALPAAGGQVKLTEGSFSIAAQITTTKANSHLEGAGVDATYLFVVNAGGAPVNTAIVNLGHAGCSATDVTVDGNKANNAAATAMWLVRLLGSAGLARNVRAVNSPGLGFFMDATGLRSRIINSLAEGCVAGGYQARSHATLISQVINCYAYSNAGVGGFYADGGPVQFVGCVSTSNAGVGFSSTVADVVFQECIANGNTTYGFGLGGAGNTASGCVARNNTTDGINVSGAICAIRACSIASNGGQGINGTAAAHDGSVVGNAVVSNTLNGISVQGARWVINDNRVSSSGQNGISTTGSDHLIDGNASLFSGFHGIATSSPNCVITNNLCVGSSQTVHNTYFGISGPGANAVVSGNTCRQSTLANKPSYGAVLNSANMLLGTNDFYDSGVQGQLALLGGATGPRRPANVLLDYAPLTDLLSATAITAGVWQNVHTDQSFTVTTPNALIAILVTGNMTGLVGGTPAQWMSRLWIDNAQEVKISGGIGGAGVSVSPILTGVYVIGTLAAGAHTVRLQITTSVAGCTAFMRAASTPYEFFRIQVVEYTR